MDIRNVVLDDVIGILEEKKPLHKVLLNSLKGIGDQRDRGFVARLVRGTVERALSIDHIIDGVSSVKVGKQKPVIRNILRAAVYQIIFMDGVADFAAVNESVKLAGKRGFRSLGGFVNGVLRNICRNKDEIVSKISLSGRENLSLKYSMPEWITGYMCDSFGEKATERAFEYFLGSNGVSIRLNGSKISSDEFYKGSSLNLERNPYMDDCFKVFDSGNIEEVKEFGEGLFVVQDMSSALVGYVVRGLVRDAGGTVLDLCAAPGGKSMYFADLGLDVTACDVSEAKLSIMRKNMERCGFKSVSLLVNDATAYNVNFEGRFGLVLCDLPCSGLGIIGKKPDIKYNATEDKVKELADLQRSILTNAVRYVAPGGRLIYSTCTLTRQENNDNVEFIESRLGLRGIPLKGLLPKGIAEGAGDGPFIQILPGEFDSDGFFISCFEKQ